MSYAAALKLGVVDNGTAFVEVTALAPGAKPSQTQTKSASAATSAPVVAKSPRTNVGVFLQIGAFRERENAERLSNKVAPYLDNRTRIQEVLNNGAPVYRVQIGPIINVHTADRFVDQLFALGIAEHHFIVQ